MAHQSNIDSIANLPFDILQHINSFLPLKEAVRTSILSHTWRTLWTPTHEVVVFNNTNFVNKSIAVLDKFLGSSEHPEIKKLSCSFETDQDEEELCLVATKGGLDQELHLQFSYCMKTQFQNYNLKLGLEDFIPKQTHLRNLRKLYLRSLNFLADKCVSDLLTNCRFLEFLKLEKCCGLESVEIEKSCSVQSLMILDCREVKSVLVSAPNLTSFTYRGVLAKMELNNSSNLKEVVLDLTDPARVELECEDILSLLASVKEVETLTITGWLLEWLCSAGVRYGQLEFQFSKLKRLLWIDSSMDVAKRDSLACFFSICPIIQTLYVKVDSKRNSVGCPHFHHFWHEPHLWMDYTAMMCNVSQLKQLKAVKLLGFTLTNKDEEDIIVSFLDLLLEKAVVLKSMAVEYI